MNVRRVWAWAMAAALTGAAAAMGAGGTSAVPASAPATAPAVVAPKTVAALAKAFLDGRTAEVEAGLAAIKDVGLTPAERADLNYIRAAYQEARPAWWKQVKLGRTMNFRPVVWNRVLNATFEPGAQSGVQMNRTGDRVTVTLTWAHADMDSSEHAEHGFTKGELGDLGVFLTIGQAEAWSNLTGFNLLSTEAGKTLFSRYLAFRADVTGATYAMPRARRWGLFLCCISYMAKFEGPMVNGRRVVGASLIAELLSKPEKYPSLKIPADVTTEEAAALALKTDLEKTPLTLAEDRMLRDFLKALAANNDFSTLKTGRFTLPNGLPMAFDPEQDKPLREKRDAWIKAKIAVINKPKP